VNAANNAGCGPRLIRYIVQKAKSLLKHSQLLLNGWLLLLDRLNTWQLFAIITHILLSGKIWFFLIYANAHKNTMLVRFEISVVCFHTHRVEVLIFFLYLLLYWVVDLWRGVDLVQINSIFLGLNLASLMMHLLNGLYIDIALWLDITQRVIVVVLHIISFSLVFFFPLLVWLHLLFLVWRNWRFINKRLRQAILNQRLLNWLVRKVVLR